MIQNAIKSVRGMFAQVDPSNKDSDVSPQDLKIERPEPTENERDLVALVKRRFQAASSVKDIHVREWLICQAFRMKAKGFVALDNDKLIEFVVQDKIDGFGTQDDLSKRHQIEEALNKALGWTGNGHCDGGDIGSGTSNVWCYVLTRQRQHKLQRPS